MSPKSLVARQPSSFAWQLKKGTDIIGPSGCGKSSLLRCFNRMNDLIPVAKLTDETNSLFTNPSDKPTEDYIIGRFG